MQMTLAASFRLFVVIWRLLGIGMLLNLSSHHMRLRPWRKWSMSAGVKSGPLLVGLRLKKRMRSGNSILLLSFGKSYRKRKRRRIEPLFEICRASWLRLVSKFNVTNKDISK
jgi:hypothetical protein